MDTPPPSPLDALLPPADGVARMLADIALETELTRAMTGRDHLDPKVLAALARIPRERFVPDGLRDQAWWNGPLPIGHGQTISQPFIVALMTDLLSPRPGQRILEVGTGSGYQTAVLACLAGQVVSLEIVDALARQAEERLRALGFENARVIAGDGSLGWPAEAPYDGILVTAAAPGVPAPLVDQLKPGGRLVIPVGRSGWSQTLKVLTKSATGEVAERNVLDVAFVPLTGAHGQRP